LHEVERLSNIVVDVLELVILHALHGVIALEVILVVRHTGLDCVHAGHH
jgi:hypothetical protein